MDTSWVLLCFLITWMYVPFTNAVAYNVDLERTDICTLSGPQTVSPYDIYRVFADPPQDGRGTRDRCTVKFTGLEGRTFKLHVRDLIFRECQVFVRIYDGDMNLNTPRYEFDCNKGAGGLYVTYSSEIAISLEKPDSSSTGYKFYILLATSDGPDIGGIAPEELTESKPISTATIAGIISAVVIVIAIIVIVGIYMVIMYRRKRREKFEKDTARSRSTLFPPSTASTIRGDSSIHSSHHSSHHSTHHSSHVNKDNKAFVYPAFRTKPSISEKNAACDSIDTMTTDQESVFTDDEKLKKSGKNVDREFDSMRRGLLRERHRHEMEEEDLRQQELSREEARRFDKQGRDESRRGLGRTNRNRENRLISSDNIKGSLREARNKGRPLTGDSHGKSNKDSGLGSMRSSRSKLTSRNHSPARSAHSAYTYRDEYDSEDTDRYRHRSRERTRSTRSKPRSSSTGSQSRHRRDYYDDRDNFSDYDDRRRHRSREPYDNDNGHRSRRDSYNRNQRSGTQRSRSQSASGRRR